MGGRAGTWLGLHMQNKHFSVASGSRADIITLWIECKQLG